MKAWELKRSAKSKRDLAVFIRDGFQCVYCGHDGRTFEGWCHLEVDHVVPKHLVKRGGEAPEHPDNLVTACMSCNSLKGQYKAKNFKDANAEVLRLRTQMREKVWALEFEPHLPDTIDPRGPKGK